MVVFRGWASFVDYRRQDLLFCYHWTTAAVLITSFIYFVAFPPLVDDWFYFVDFCGENFCLVLCYAVDVLVIVAAVGRFVNFVCCFFSRILFLLFLFLFGNQL